jgi:hypothetical protein
VDLGYKLSSSGSGGAALAAADENRHSNTARNLGAGIILCEGLQLCAAGHTLHQ